MRVRWLLTHYTALLMVLREIDASTLAKQQPEWLATKPSSASLGLTDDSPVQAGSELQNLLTLAREIARVHRSDDP